MTTTIQLKDFFEFTSIEGLSTEFEVSSNTLNLLGTSTIGKGITPGEASGLADRITAFANGKESLVALSKSQVRDRLQACLIVAFTVAGVAAVVFAYTTGSPLIGVGPILSLLIMGTLLSIRLDDWRRSYPLLSLYHPITGIPRSVHHLWTRKDTCDRQIQEEKKIIRWQLLRIAKGLEKDISDVEQERDWLREENFSTEGAENRLSQLKGPVQKVVDCMKQLGLVKEEV